MSQEQAQLLMLKGVISDLPKQAQEQIKEIKQKLEDATAGYDVDISVLAVGVFSAEFMAKL